MKYFLSTIMVTVLLSANADIIPFLAAKTKPENPVTLERLSANRKKLLEAPPASVTFDKTLTAPSGDKHDYISVGIYWWPDPKKADGLPYIRRDGHTNPDAYKNDSGKLQRLIIPVRDIALLYHFIHDEELAAHAVKMLQTFFIVPETKMNPHLTYAQSVPGREPGRPIGIIDTYSMIDLVDSIALLKNAAAMDTATYQALQNWFRDYMNWLLSPPMKKAFAGSHHNIAIAYNAQIIAYALFAGENDTARRQLENLKKLLPKSIRPDGIMPEEVARTKSWDYSVYALNILLSAVSQGYNLDINLLAADTESGRLTRAAVDYLCGYVDRPGDWPYQQLNGPININALGNILRKMHFFTKEDKYRQYYLKLKKPQETPITALFYPAILPD